MTDTDATAGTAAAFQELVDSLRATFNSGRTRSLDWRKAQLRGLIRMFEEHAASSSGRWPRTSVAHRSRRTPPISGSRSRKSSSC